ncbi:NAD(P)/FAD-dependent oxidoreductase [Haloechinothrix sp. YIM 98757]|uniref:NAD(P)/FAD-dependent oxidoreductase n=1 Tax=Haloechinothrix aidingensis TaxID=2752311 RepID=A0A838AFI2_9PSEU|nr:FAD-dependent oxidoreductase [Haloechinothrix aidingensis]MBA0127961.1 NAD(P)/FAD-dependent oxidoreductase [Haloechinothrix aidingensis]
MNGTVGRPRNVVIAGYGMAGARLAENIRTRDPRGERLSVTVVGAEPHAAYNRVLLSSVVAGTLPRDAVTLHPESWAAEHDVTLRLGETVSAIDTAARTVRVHGPDGEPAALDYDALVLAQGSSPWIPPVDGLVHEDGSLATGVCAFRTLDDCAEIAGRARAGTPVAVIGGGLLGIEAARGLAGRGCRVTVIHPYSHVMERQLDRGAGDVLAGTLAGYGIEFRTGTTAARYVPGDGVKLDDGGYVPADLVVVSAGVRPETGLAASAGLEVDRGIVVDDCLRTSDPRVHAIGDCAQHPGTPPGLVQPAWDQAGVLADLLTGADGAGRYRGTAAVTRLKASGVDLASFGDVGAEPDSPDDEVVCLNDPARGRYAKLVLRDDLVTGGVLLGVPDAAANVAHHYTHRTPAPADRLAFLLGRTLPEESVRAPSPASMPGSVTVCECNNVPKSGLVDAWRRGARSVSGLAEATRATTGCGSCTGLVRGIADWLESTE